MDVQFINPVLKSLVEVLDTMANVKVTPGKIRLKERDEPILSASVTGLMNIVGGRAKASVALTFPRPVLLQIAQSMLGSQSEYPDGTLIDMTGELANMVMGGAKQRMELVGYKFEMSLPTVIMGNDYLIAHKTKAPVLEVSFTADAGSFFVEASFEPVLAK